ncbi:enoyl-CoA hydratase/isomerase family protein [Thioalbus denitrificans]|uniref:Methylglutaconyl-CoA hydratase n=1 Tax=Thioalbus denitrificans TaxID=547122 RepID=A0A369CF89_9GAMM|nr:enoyl-CoA hydratase/isomerase family protein [Thioalbus denitrificans]RCX32343.1 methylglutaconyl-CoA hydratase [Thioalbus denitrificans]
MSEETVKVAVEKGVASVTLNRPAVHNAFDDALIARLTEALREVGEDPGVRVVVLRGAGKSFSAGADLNWMQRMAGYSRTQNLADAMGLAQLLHTLDTLPRPTIAAVHGAAFGGGVGLVAACDIAVAAETAAFSLSEVRLGLIPAVISPYVVAAIGARQARRYFLTAERFDAGEARRLGLVHEVTTPEALEARVTAIATELLRGGPGAIGAAKNLVAAVAGRPVDTALMADTARRIADIRAGEEAREGVGAFLEKRKPRWFPE